MKKLVLILLMLIALCKSYAQEINFGLPYVKYYTSQEYKGGIQNWSIAQNSLGLIYVANNFGVLEYDGSTWRRHTPPMHTKIRHISIGPEGKIYVASQGNLGYYFPSDSGFLQYEVLNTKIPEDNRDFDEVWRVFVDGRRKMFCTFKQIFIFEDDSLVQVVRPGPLMENFFYVNNQLYIDQFATGLSVLVNGELQLLPNTEILQGSTVTAIINMANNQLLIVTRSKGIFIYNGHSFEKWPGMRPEFSENYLNCAIRLNNGNFAFGTQNSGLYILNPAGELVLHLNKNQGLANRTVLCLFEDGQNNLWLGHNNGISCVELDMPFKYITEQVGLPGTGYAGFLDNQVLYLGSNNGLYFKDFRQNVVNDENELSYIDNTEKQIYSISKINEHLIVGHHTGALEIKGFKARQISEAVGTWLFLELNNRPGYYIEGTYRGLHLLKDVNGQLRYQHPVDGFQESSRVMVQDEDGGIWMTHGYKGVYHLTLNAALDSVVKADFYGTESGLPYNLNINVFSIRNRPVFTTMGGVYKYNKQTDRFERDPFYEQFFGDEAITAMAQDPNENIYFLSQQDMGVLRKDASGQYVKEVSVFNKVQDMLNDDLQNISILDNSNVLYGAKEGFILYHPNFKKQTDLDFSVLIRNVTCTGDSNTTNIFGGNFVNDGQLVNTQNPAEIPNISYNNNSLLLNYSATFIDGLSQTEYQYWLENAEPGWSTWTYKTEKEYTQLREGKYTFHVRAKNIFGTLSDVASYSFIINPPWYRTSWSYTAYFLLLITSLFISFYLFDKKHQHEKQVMSLQQKEELNQKETEIRETTDEIERLRSEKLKAEIDAKNKELATSTMNLINKNGFIVNVKDHLNNIARRSRYQELKTELGKIVSDIDKNISQDDDWEQFSFHFDQVHGDFTSRLKEAYPDLSPQEMKVSAYLRMNLSTKEMAHLLNISVRGVEISRYRLRKKLNLERSENLQEFILKF